MRTLRTYEITLPNGVIRRAHAGGVVSALAMVGWQPKAAAEKCHVRDVASGQKYIAALGEKGLEVKHA